MSAEGDAVLTRLVGREAGLIVASLHRRTGNFDVAEEAVQEAVVAALQTWRRDGVPPNPAAWLTLTAQRRAIDLLRKLSRERRVVDELELEVAAAEAVAPSVPPEVADDRLPMLFGCCHPALRVDVRIALTMRAVMGMTTAQIAHAFLLPEPTLAQRLVRAKHKITAAGIPFAVPEDEDLARRLNDVLTVIYLCYNEGYLHPVQELRGLVDDAIWLAELVAGQLDREPEAWGLLALLTFLASRARARFDDTDALVLLADQDRRRWDQVAIARADGYLTRAAAFRRPGTFQLQAAIAACHSTSSSWAETDWLQIVTLYDMLLRLDGSPVVRLNRAIALGRLEGPAVALAEVDTLGPELETYHLLHATRAHLLSELGRVDEAMVANARALALAANPVERDLLRSRLDGVATLEAALAAPNA
jgi:predicted RNA polymerase sigma factor